MGEEIGIDKDGVWGDESGVGLEEEGGGDLGDFADHFCVWLFVLGG